MTRKIAIGVVTYKPNLTLTFRLQTAIDLGFSVYIFDNSPEVELIRQFLRKFSRDIVKYITCGKNVGLGYGISTVCAQAYYDNYPALIFFDQDTVFDKGTLDFIERFYISKVHLEKRFSAIVFNSKNVGDADPGMDDKNRFIYNEVLMAINSGSLYFLKNLKKMNWHNETYFVDGVDYEFCLNSNNNHFKIGECSLTPGFDHMSEQGDARYSICGRIFLVRKYSMSRITDAIISNLRLLVTSIKTGNFSFAIEISRLLAGYLVYQLITRVAEVVPNLKK